MALLQCPREFASHWLRTQEKYTKRHFESGHWLAGDLRMMLQHIVFGSVRWQDWRELVLFNALALHERQLRILLKENRAVAEVRFLSLVCSELVCVSS